MLRELKENYNREKARLEGKARSEARMIKLPVDIDGLKDQLRPGCRPAVPIAGALVRTKDGATMQAWTDGTWRHAFGKKLTRAAKKRAKKARRHAVATAR